MSTSDSIVDEVIRLSYAFTALSGEEQPILRITLGRETYNRLYAEVIARAGRYCEVGAGPLNFLGIEIRPASEPTNKLREELEKEREINKVLIEALNLQIEDPYGAQGYIEDGDTKGLAEYWAKGSTYTQYIARKALAKAEELRKCE